MLEYYIIQARKSDFRVHAAEIQHRMDFAQIRKVERLERALKSACGHLRLGPPSSATVRPTQG